METFQQAIESLLKLAQQEEESLEQETEIDEQEKQITKALIMGYGKALEDLLSILEENSTEATQTTT